MNQTLIQYVDVILCALLICYAPFIWLFYQNRTVHPIKGRMPRVVLLLDVLLIVYAAHITAVVVEEVTYPCIVRDIFSMLLPILSAGIYNYRMMRLLFSYEITKNIIEFSHQGHVNWQENWYTRHRGFLSPKAGYIYGSLTAMMYITFLAVFFNFNQDYSTLLGCYAYPQPEKLYNVVLAGGMFACLLATVVLGWLLRKHGGDAFSIKLEFNIAACSGGSALIVWVIFSSISLPSLFWIPGVAILLCVHSILYTSTVWPYFLSLKARKLEEAVPDFDLDLKDLIRTRTGYQTFLLYLQREFSSENLIFWREVEDLHELGAESNVELLREKATGIYQKYIPQGAACQVNLPYTIRSEILNDIMLITEDETIGMSAVEITQIFDEAQREIFSLMNGDAFHRFEQTTEFRQLKHSIFHNSVNSSSREPRVSLASRYAAGCLEIELPPISYIKNSDTKEARPQRPKSDSEERHVERTPSSHSDRSMYSDEISISHQPPRSLVSVFLQFSSTHNSNHTHITPPPSNSLTQSTRSIATTSPLPSDALTPTSPTHSDHPSKNKTNFFPSLTISTPTTFVTTSFPSSASSCSEAGSPCPSLSSPDNTPLPNSVPNTPSNHLLLQQQQHHQHQRALIPSSVSLESFPSSSPHHSPTSASASSFNHNNHNNNNHNNNNNNHDNNHDNNQISIFSSSSSTTASTFSFPSHCNLTIPTPTTTHSMTTTFSFPSVESIV